MPHSEEDVQPLEPRRLLTVTIVGSSLVGTPGDDVIEVTHLRGSVHRITVNGDSRKLAALTFKGIKAAGGNDRITITGAAAALRVVNAGPGDDTVQSSATIDRITGASGNDTITTTGRTDNIAGGGGDDVITADGASNEILAGAGNDLVHGGGGNDEIQGQGGDDTLLGDEGNDLLYGDKKDAPRAAGSDDLSGGKGRDRAPYQGRTANLTLSLDGSANDGEPGEADNVRPDIEQLTGGAGNDHITGSESADDLAGHQGTDTILGLGGNDTISGEGIYVPGVPRAANHLDGGDGDDVIQSSGPGSIAFGRGGNDHFAGIGGRLDGGDGDDLFDELLGFSDIFAGSGNDSIYVRNNKPDTIDGGLGDDLANIDDRGDSHQSIESGIRPR